MNLLCGIWMGDFPRPRTFSTQDENLILALVHTLPLTLCAQRLLSLAVHRASSHSQIYIPHPRHPTTAGKHRKTEG